MIDPEWRALLSSPRFDYGALQALSTTGVTHGRGGTVRVPVLVGLDSTRRYRDEREDI